MLAREQWLHGAVDKLREHFKNAGYKYSESLRVSCGWPVRGGLSETKRVVGQYFPPDQSVDGVPQIFISPYLDDKHQILATLVHELIHDCFPFEEKHGPNFKEAAKKLGLVGKATHTSPSDQLKFSLFDQLIDELGPFDHGRIEGTEGSDGPKKQKGRQLKVFCPRLDLHENSGDYILRASQKVINMGLPECPVCGTQMEAEKIDEAKQE